MDHQNKFDMYVGGKTGVFKGIKVNKNDCTMENLQNLVCITDDDEITTISWGDNEEEEILIACGAKRTRSIKVFDVESSTFTCSFFCNVGTGKINGISRYDEAILTAIQSGEIKLWRFEEENGILINAGENLDRMRHCKVTKNLIATGGKEHPLKLFDLEKQNQVFQAKNIRNDWLEMRVPIWISDVDFLPNTEQIVSVGRYGQIQLYDHKAQRRPVISLEVKDEPWTTLGITPREKQIIVGSGKGKMNLVDLRKPSKVLNTYKGFVGGVTGISCSTSEPYVVSVSLDRYLRIHHIDTKKLLKKIYLTSKMSCVLLHAGFSLPLENKENGNCVKSYSVKNDTSSATNGENKLKQTVSDSDSEYDMLFDNMQVVSSKDEKSIKRKHKISSDKKTVHSKFIARKLDKSEQSCKKLKSSNSL